MTYESLIARHVMDIPRSGIRDFFEVVQSMTDVISLGIGEPDFATPWHIREAAIYGLEKGRTGYTSNLGTPRLRRSISDYVGRNFGMNYDPRAEILVTVGVSEAIDLVLRAVLNPGDEVIYHIPSYVSYSPSIVLAHGVPRAINARAEDEFVPAAEAIEAAITPKTKAVLLNFPTNPTGAVLAGEALQRMADVCVRHDLLVISDEVYAELTYDGQRHESIAALPGMRERTVFLHGMSKAFAMTGWRLGYACAPAPIIEAMMKVHQYAIMCASIMAQEAACEALDHGASSVEAMRREYELRRNYIVQALNDAGLECHKPRGAFYVFPKIASTGLDSREFSMRLLREKHVAVVPGTAFGASGEGYVRCSYATSLSQIKQAAVRIAEFCGEIRSVSRAA